MPPRFTPFFQSLANRGMKQTNKNIGNINNPGGGNIYDPGDFSGEGNPIGEEGMMPPGSGIGGWYNPWGPNPDYDPDYDPNPDFTDPLEGIEDLNNDGVVDIHDIILSNMGPGSKTKPPLGVLPPGHGFAKPPSPTSPSPIFPDRPKPDFNFSGGGLQQVDSPYDVRPEENVLDPDWGGLVEPPGVPDKPSDELPQGYTWQYINGEWIPSYIGVGGGSLDIPDYLQEPIDQPYQTTTYGLEDYVGGGGMGGQAAKKLYYPGTSGGFASVGSGIGGGNTLEELLKKYQG